MLKEYAIDPESLIQIASNRLAYRYIMDNFGIGQARLMAEFPKSKKWNKQFRIAAASLEGTNRTRVELLAKYLKEAMVTRSNIEYNGEHPWLENAIREDNRHPFSAICTEKNPKQFNRILLRKDIGDWPETLWGAKKRFIVKRDDVKSMVKILSPLLQISSEIIFVDPYFMPNKPQFIQPLEAFLIDAINCSVYHVKQKIELHVRADRSNPKDIMPPDQFERLCRNLLPPHIPQNIKIVIKRWKQREGKDKLHNRYILTNLGGVLFGTGLDRGKEGETDDLFLLNREQHANRWNQFNYPEENSPEFELEHNFEIKRTS